MRELALFAGAGGGILGGRLLGWETICAVELDAFCARRLMQRQAEGHLPSFPIWDDVRTFRGRDWRGIVDVVSGGFPCQDISSAGPRTGLDGERSGLWREYARIIAEVEPAWVLIENSPHLRTRGLVIVLQDLARMGFDAKWGVLGADSVGADHYRKRMWIVAHANNKRKRTLPEYAEMAGTSEASRVIRATTVAASVGRGPGRARRLAASVAGQREFAFQAPDTDGEALREQSGRLGGTSGQGSPQPGNAHWWPVDLIQGVDDGVASRMERVRATGNGQVPRVVELAWRTLSDKL